jgi:uncharacterized protein YaaR (DUF327 family)
MDKVDSLDAAFFSRRSEEKKTRKKAPVGRRQFADVVREAGGGEAAAGDFDRPGRRRRSLEELLDEVHSSGGELLETQSLEAIKRYRAAVRSFLDLVLARMLATEQRSSAAGVARRKRFTQIRIIDQKLERLVSDLLADQHRQLDILGRVNEIGGLLVDLLG